MIIAGIRFIWLKIIALPCQSVSHSLTGLKFLVQPTLLSNFLGSSTQMSPFLSRRLKLNFFE